ncbi:MAG: DsbA family oxidoreductase [wastewater metagenome]|nr:DsbA family oxidoreductase [Candidatus Loosdrechtia aerotolerans]
MTNKHQVHIAIWSDYVCPFCYLEMPIFHQIRKEFDEVIEEKWYAFELRSDPVPTLDPESEYLRVTWERAVYPMARMREMTLRLPPVQPRSRKAFEAAKFAHENGRFEAMNQAIFRTFFEEGRDIGDNTVLLDIGVSVGLDREKLREALDTGQYTDQVLEDEKLAHDLRITAVPTMLIGKSDQPLKKSVVITGAQPYKILRTTIERMIHEKPLETKQ